MYRLTTLLISLHVCIVIRHTRIFCVHIHCFQMHRWIVCVYGLNYRNRSRNYTCHAT